MTIREHMFIALRAAAARDDRRVITGSPGSSRSGSVRAAVIALALDNGYIEVSGYYAGRVARARERCAEDWNERHGGEP